MSVEKQEQQYSLFERLLKPLIRRTLNANKFAAEVEAEAKRSGLREEEDLVEIEEDEKGGLSLVTYDPAQDGPQAEPITIKNFPEIAARLSRATLFAEVNGTPKIVRMPRAMQALSPTPTGPIEALAAALQNNAFAPASAEAKSEKFSAPKMQLGYSVTQD